jgi:hypothetical protein
MLVRSDTNRRGTTRCQQIGDQSATNGVEFEIEDDGAELEIELTWKS